EALAGLARAVVGPRQDGELRRLLRLELGAEVGRDNEQQIDDSLFERDAVGGVEELDVEEGLLAGLDLGRQVLGAADADDTAFLDAAEDDLHQANAAERIDEQRQEDHDEHGPAITKLIAQ